MDRNTNIDILKFLCAILVVFIHIPTPYSEYIKPLTRCAVPCFFMISGFFLLNSSHHDQTTKRLKKSIIKMLKLIIWSSLLYAIIIYRLNPQKFNNLLSIDNLADFIIFNINPIYGHLWFLNAYLYVLCITLFAVEHHKIKLINYLIPILLLGNLVMGELHQLFMTSSLPVYYTRNFLFTGLPFFYLGGIIRNNTSITNKETINYKALILIILFAFTSYVESVLLSKQSDIYISTIFLSYFMLTFFVSIKRCKKSFISQIGERDSLYIYILHIAVMLLLYPIVKKIITDKISIRIFECLAPTIYIIVCIIISKTIFTIKHRINNKLQINT